MQAKKDRQQINGQTLLEFILGLVFVLAVFGGGARLLRTYWDRLKCAHAVFEQTHAALIGGHSNPFANPFANPFKKVFVAIRDEGNSVTGSATCGDAQETVKFFKLEAGTITGKIK